MTPDAHSQGESKAWFRHLTLGYLFALGLIALLAITGQILIQHTISERASASHVVDLAGRQRMLSQRLVKLVLLLGRTADGPQRQSLLTDLRQALDLWDTAHQGLQTGNPELGLPGRNSAPILELFAVIEPHQAAIHAAVQDVFKAYDDPGTNPKLQAEIESPVQSILVHEGPFVRRAKALISSGCNSHPATVASAGSNRSGSGGNETAEASDGKDRYAVPRAKQAVTRVNAEQASKHRMWEPTQ